MPIIIQCQRGKRPHDSRPSRLRGGIQNGRIDSTWFHLVSHPFHLLHDRSFPIFCIWQLQRSQQQSLGQHCHHILQEARDVFDHRVCLLPVLLRNADEHCELALHLLRRRTGLYGMDSMRFYAWHGGEEAGVSAYFYFYDSIMYNWFMAFMAGDRWNPYRL